MKPTSTTKTARRARPLKAGTAVLAVLAMSTAAACGGTAKPAAGPLPTPTASGQAATPTASPSPGTSVGTGLSTDTAIPATGWAGLTAGPTVAFNEAGGSHVGVLAVQPNGTLLITRGKVDKNFTDDGAEVPPNQVQLMTPGTTTTQQIRGISTATGAQEGAADAHHAAWVDITRVDKTHERWTLYVRDLSTGTTHTIASQTTTALGPDASDLHLAAGRIWWTAAATPLDTGSSFRQKHPALYSRDVNGTGPVRREVAGTNEYSANGNGLFYVKDHNVDASAPAGQSVIHHRDLTTGTDTIVETVQLGSSQLLTGIASHGSELVRVTTTHGNDLARATATLVLRTADGTLTTITGHTAYAYPVLTADWIGWTDGTATGHQWIYDRHRNVVVDLGEAPAESRLLITGNHLMWRADGGDWHTGVLQRATTTNPGN